MIPYLKAQIAQSITVEEQRSLVREYLQMRILHSMQGTGAMIPLAFHGRTALRILYKLPRFSEDLEFALERQREQYDLRKYLTAIQREMVSETYDVEVKLSDQRPVHSAFIRFRGLLHRLDISPHASEVLAIKLEVDTNPPNGATLNTAFVQNHVSVNLQHHDQASLLAGKLYAILQRDYVKGRDWYDLYWYLSQPHWKSPNIGMLNSALDQSGWTKGVVTNDNWRQYVMDRLEQLAWERVVEDVERFLINQDELTLFNKKTIAQLLIT